METLYQGKESLKNVDFALIFKLNSLTFLSFFNISWQKTSLKPFRAILSEVCLSSKFTPYRSQNNPILNPKIWNFVLRVPKWLVLPILAGKYHR